MNYDNQFTNNVLTALRTYALSLPNGPAGYELTLQGASNSIAAGVTGPPPNNHPLSGLCECDWVAADAANGVARVTLDRRTTFRAVGGFRERKHAMVLTFTNAPAGFDAYFLPWDGRGGVAYMTLAAGAGTPDYFFTAALSGCSVMVVGPAGAPTVYHCGVDAWANSPYTQAPHNNPAPAANVTPEIWVDLVAHLPGGPAAGTIDKTNYVNDFTAGHPMTTANSRAIEGLLQGSTGDNNATAVAWGADCGERGVGGNWSFYLQENVTLTWRLRGARRFFARAALGRIVLNRSSCRPIQVFEFYQNPNIHTRLWNL